jgi:aspartate ammonia-lyase
MALILACCHVPHLAISKEALAAEVRIEHDSLGERSIPNSVYYGVQTIRALENFPFNTHKLQHFPNFIIAYAQVKKAATLANYELGILPREKMNAIVAACDEIIGGKLHDQFVVDMMQGGAGTSTNMNVNEVIANRGLEIMGHLKGEHKFLHPNDDVNLSQSTNDNYPTAARLAILMGLKDAFQNLEDLKRALEDACERGELEERRDDGYYLDWLARSGLVASEGGGEPQRAGEDQIAPPVPDDDVK